MKYVLFLLCSLILLASVRSDNNITGQWLLDWQSVRGVVSVCFPRNFTINAVNSTYYMNLNFDEFVLQGCSQARTINSTSITLNLTFNSSNLYTDSFGEQIIFDNVTQVLTYTLTEDGDPDRNGTYYYTRTGQIIPEQEALGTLNGFWINPIPANASANHSQCCVPDRIWLDVDMDNSDYDVDLDSLLYYDTTNCAGSKTTFQVGRQGNFSATTLTWQSYYPTQTISYSPLINLTQIQLMFGNANCTYNYTRNNTGNYLNGTWQLDWQSFYGYAPPSTYQITLVNNTGAPYMATTLYNSTGYAYSHDFLNENPSTGLYDDHYFYDRTLSLAYDQPTNTLLDSHLSVLFSPTGALFNSSSFLTVWNNPQAVNNGSTDDCCVPTSIYINGLVNTYSAIANYYIPDYANQPACEDLTLEISNNTVESNIYTIPNLHQLVWNDTTLNFNITYLPTATDPIITLTSHTNPGQCTFTMNNLPGPNPGPKSSQRISFGVISVIIGLFLSFVAL